MKHKKEEYIHLLTKLIEGNTNRIDSYSEAIQSLDNATDADLIQHFEASIQQSQQFKSQLTPLIYRAGDTEIEPTSTKKMLSQMTVENFNDTLLQQRLIMEQSIIIEHTLQKLYQDVASQADIFDEQTKKTVASQSELLTQSYTDALALMQK